MNTIRNTHSAYNGFDITKYVLSILVVVRHSIQTFLPVESPVYILIVYWLSNICVPMFFTISGFLLYKKVSVKNLKWNIVGSYILRLLKIYVFWSLVYLPINILSWIKNGDIIEGIFTYIYQFIFTSNVVQLWYFPSLIFACIFTWFALFITKNHIVVLSISIGLFVIGVFGNNERIISILGFNTPEIIININKAYIAFFQTTRNGIFYGSIFVSLGMYFALSEQKTTTNTNVRLLCCIASFAVMLVEAICFKSINMLFSSFPTSFFLFKLVCMRTQETPMYKSFRIMSTWIFCAHMIIIILVSWIINRFNAPSAAIIIVITLLTCCFSYIAYRLSRNPHLKWLNNFI